MTNAFCLMIPLLVGIFNVLCFFLISFFVFFCMVYFWTSSSDMFFSYLCFNLASSLSLQRRNICVSLIALSMVFVVACEVHVGAARLTKDHSGCGPLTMANFHLMKIHADLIPLTRSLALAHSHSLARSLPPSLPLTHSLTHSLMRD